MQMTLNRNTKKILKQRKKTKLNPIKRSRYIWAYIFILPQALFFFGFSIYPIVMSYVYSLYNWDGLGPLKDFVGWGNYIRILFHTPRFWADFGHSLVYTAGFTIISVLAGLILALILNEPRFKGKAIYRTIYFLPVVTTTAIVGIIMHNIFGIQGFFNQVLQFLHISNMPIHWLDNSTLAMGVLIVVGSWKYIGITMIYWLTGLQMIPNELYEASRIDGAKYWQTTRYITIPLLLSVGATILLLTIVGGMQVFDLVRTLTNGDPYFSTETIELFIYRNAFNPKAGTIQIGFASAAGVILGVFVTFLSVGLGGLVVLANRVTQTKRKKVGEV